MKKLAQIAAASFYKASSLLKAGSLIKDMAESWKLLKKKTAVITIAVYIFLI